MQAYDHSQNVENNLRTFQTEQGSLVTYWRPSELLRDAGGGYPEAYQVYSQEDHPENLIAFLISDRYTDSSGKCTGADVRKAWQVGYGQLLYFHFTQKEGPGPLMEARGRTAAKALAACVFRDGADTMEVVLEIDLLHTPEDIQQQLYKEFEALIQTIQVSGCLEDQTPSGPQAPGTPRWGGRHAAAEKKERSVRPWLWPVLAVLAAAVIALIICFAGR